MGGGSDTGVYAVPCIRPSGEHGRRLDHVKLTTGPIRSSSEGFVGTSELGTVAECAGTERGVATTVGGGRGAAGGGGEAAETVGFGASQVPIGTRAAVAALPTLVVRKVGPDGVGAAGIPAEE